MDLCAVTGSPPYRGIPLSAMSTYNEKRHSRVLNLLSYRWHFKSKEWMKAMDVKIAVLNVMSLSLVTSHKWIALWGCFLNIFVKGMIFYEIGHLE